MESFDAVFEGAWQSFAGASAWPAMFGQVIFGSVEYQLG
jgi:hypothetical protein